MLSSIRLLLFYAFFYAPVIYTSQPIVLLHADSGSNQTTKELDQKSKEYFRKTFAKAQETQGIYVYSFHSKTVKLNDATDTPNPAQWNDFIDAHHLPEALIFEHCIGLNIENKRDSLVHAVWSRDYSTYAINKENKNNTSALPRWETARTSPNTTYNCPKANKNDTIIYIIGDDSATVHPVYKSVEIDAEWHAHKINIIKETFHSVFVLISKNLYQKIAPTIIENTKTKIAPTIIENTKIDVIIDKTPIRTSYNRILILSLALTPIIAGLLYKYFYN